MPLHPYENLHKALILAVAAGLYVFKSGVSAANTGGCFDAAERFVNEAEKRYGTQEK